MNVYSIRTIYFFILLIQYSSYIVYTISSSDPHYHFYLLCLLKTLYRHIRYCIHRFLTFTALVCEKDEIYTLKKGWGDRLRSCAFVFNRNLGQATSSLATEI